MTNWRWPGMTSRSSDTLADEAEAAGVVVAQALTTTRGGRLVHRPHHGAPAAATADGPALAVPLAFPWSLLAVELYHTIAVLFSDPRSAASTARTVHVRPLGDISTAYGPWRGFTTRRSPTRRNLTSRGRRTATSAVATRVEGEEKRRKT